MSEAAILSRVKGLLKRRLKKKKHREPKRDCCVLQVKFLVFFFESLGPYL